MKRWFTDFINRNYALKLDQMKLQLSESTNALKTSRRKELKNKLADSS